ncbi:MAG: phage portal protein [Chloroflexi bacterium HGW-Chloroflexi-4]|jgi:HK97 family phage portal protein|nr:MAG: phage portal protein [Chloroflexi bacterium HGW-Chloroflexi-4]
MNLIAQFKSWSERNVQKAGQVFSFIQKFLTVSWMDTDFRTLIDKGYKASSAVSNCVRALAFSFPEPQLIAYKETKEGEQPVGANDPLQKLIRHPNPDMGEAEFMQFLVTYCSCGGNVYIWKERSKNGKVLYLWPFSDKDVKPVPGENPLEGFVAGYEFYCGDGGEPIYLSKNDVIHWKWMVDPEQPWKGIGAIEFAARDIQNDTESSRYTYAMFKNNAVPPIAVTTPEGDELDDATVKRLQKQWLKRYGGDNQGVPAFLQGGMTIQKLGMNMQELNLSELKNVPESRICGAFGVPPSIALLYVGLKRSDYGDGMARKSYTETTLVALWRNCASELTSSLSDEFGGGYVLQYALNQVKALAENVNELWTRLLSALDKAAITRAEFKRAVGLKVLPSDNVYRTSMINGWEPAGEAPSNPNVAIEGGSGKSNANMKGIPEKTGTRAAPEKHWLATKSNGPDESKSANAVYGRALQRIRATMWPNMSKDLDGYFATLSDRVVSRAGKALQGMSERKEGLPQIDDLLTQKDAEDLNKMLKKWFVAIAQASWETINMSMGVDIAFDMTDPAITKMLATAGGDVKDIVETTRNALQEALKYGNENGWSIQQLVKGDENQAGIQAIVDETYKGRSTTIARTEMGNAQNAVSSERYKSNGVKLVGILDNGDSDDDDECKVANGQVWTIDYFESNRLEHPNCTRCSYPIFDDVTPDQS